MATFGKTKNGITTHKIHDHYMTPKSAWENIYDYIPKDKVIWEAFYGDGESGKYLEELGFNVIHKKYPEEGDFFLDNYGEIIVSNPHFSMKKQVFTRLKELGKPFIMICPVSVLTTKYFRDLFSKCEDKIQIIIPNGRIQFKKLIDGKVPDEWEKKKDCNFDCFYYCWKINLKDDITYLPQKITYDKVKINLKINIKKMT